MIDCQKLRASWMGMHFRFVIVLNFEFLIQHSLNFALNLVLTILLLLLLFLYEAVALALNIKFNYCPENVISHIFLVFGN